MQHVGQKGAEMSCLVVGVGWASEFPAARWKWIPCGLAAEPAQQPARAG